MENRYRIGYRKFFRRLIATSQPHETEQIVERYNKGLEDAEATYMDIMLYSGGAISYQDLMTMPLPSVTILIKQMNARTERQTSASKKR